MASNREHEIKRVDKVIKKYTEQYDKLGRLNEANEIFTCFQCPEKHICLWNRLKRISKNLAFTYAQNCNYLKYLLSKMREEELK